MQNLLLWAVLYNLHFLDNSTYSNLKQKCCRILKKTVCTCQSIYTKNYRLLMNIFIIIYFLNTTGARENSAKPEETRSAAGGLVPQGGHTHTLPSGLRRGRYRSNKKKRLFKPFSNFILFISLVFLIFENKSAF